MPKQPPTIWEPSPEDYARIVREQNPWHDSEGPPEVPEVLAPPVKRPLAECLWRRLMHDSQRRFQLILGPRRVGKTTCLYQTVQQLLHGRIDPLRIWWLRLDHPLLMEVPLGDLVRAVTDLTNADANKPILLFLDELVYAQKWDLWLKTFYDERWPILIAGSSSSTAAMRDRRIESGVGRWEEQFLTPYLFGEFLQLADQSRDVALEDTLAATIQKNIETKTAARGLAKWRQRYLLTGGFPELLLQSHGDKLDEHSLLLESQRTLRSDAVERAIYKDIPQAFNIDNPMMLERLLYTLAGQITGIISPKNLCQTLDGISHPTLERYIAFLERSFLIFTLQNYSAREETKQRRGRKVYFVDTAIRNAALQRGLAPLDDPSEFGLLLENLVAAHLHALGQQANVRLYHWRQGQRDEVDLIYDHPEQPLAFEIAASSRHSNRGLKSLIDRHPKFKGRAYLVAPDIPAINAGDGVGALPLDLLLLCISAQAGQALHQRIGVAVP